MLLKGTRFSSTIKELPARVVLAVSGLQKGGKTHFALTGPDEIAYQSIDFGLEGVIQKFAEVKTIHVAEYARPLPQEVDNYDLERLKKHYRDTVWEPFKSDFKIALKEGARTIVWDTGSEFYEMQRIAHFGKLEKVPSQMYGAVNAEWAELMRMVLSQDRTSLIILQRLKDEWEQYVDNNGTTKNRKTGRAKPQTNDSVPYLAQANLVSRYVPAKMDRFGRVEVASHFELEITESRHKPELNGQVFVDADFATIANALVPEIDMGEWL